MKVRIPHRGATAIEYMAIVAIAIGALAIAYLAFGRNANTSVDCASDKLRGLVGSGSGGKACSGALGPAASPTGSAASSKMSAVATGPSNLTCDTLGCRALEAPALICKNGKCSNGIACFVAGTPVLGDHGPIAIEMINPGDRVWSRDPETHETALRAVARTKVRTDQAILRVDLDTPDGPDAIEVTSEHPFAVDGRGFVAAGELVPGDAIVTKTGIGHVRAVTDEHRVASVYNLEVEELHTYFAGRTGAWVHNDCKQELSVNVPQNGLPNNAPAMPGPKKASDPFLGAPMEATGRLEPNLRAEITSGDPNRVMAAAQTLATRAMNGDAVAFMALTREMPGGMVGPNGQNPLKPLVDAAAAGFVKAPPGAEFHRALLAAAGNADARPVVLTQLATDIGAGKKPAIDLVARALESGFDPSALGAYLMHGKDHLDADHYKALAIVAFDNRPDNAARRLLEESVRLLAPGALDALHDFAKNDKTDWKKKLANEIIEDLEYQVRRDDRKGRTLYIDGIDRLAKQAKDGDAKARETLDLIAYNPRALGQFAPLPNTPQKDWETGFGKPNTKEWLERYQAYADAKLKELDGKSDPVVTKTVDALAKAADGGDKLALDGLAEAVINGKIPATVALPVFVRHLDDLKPQHFRAVALAAFQGVGNDQAKQILSSGIGSLRPGAWEAVTRFGANKVGEVDPREYEVTASKAFVVKMQELAKKDSRYEDGYKQLVRDANNGDTNATGILANLLDRPSLLARLGPIPSGDETWGVLQQLAISYALRDLKDDKIDPKLVLSIKENKSSVKNPTAVKVLDETIAALEAGQKRESLRTQMKNAGGAIGWNDRGNLESIRYAGGGEFRIKYDDKGSVVQLVQFPRGIGEGVVWEKTKDGWTVTGRPGDKQKTDFGGTIETTKDGDIVVKTANEERTRRIDGTELVFDKASKVERVVSMDGKIVSVGPRGGKKISFKYEGKDVVEIDNAITGQTWKPAQNGMWRSNKGDFAQGRPIPTAFGIEWKAEPRTVTDESIKSMTVRSEGKELRWGRMQVFNSPFGPQLVEHIKDSTFRFPSKGEDGKVVMKDISGREVLQWKYRHLWPYLFGGDDPGGSGRKFPSPAVRGPLMDGYNPELQRLMTEDVKRLNGETGFIRNVEVSGEKYGVNKLESNEPPRQYPPDHARLSDDGRTFTWSDTKEVTVNPYRVDNVATGKTERGNFRFNAKSAEILDKRFQAERLIGSIPPSMSFPEYVLQYQSRFVQNTRSYSTRPSL